MLVVKRFLDELIILKVGDEMISIAVTEIRAGREASVSLGIHASRLNVEIFREELARKVWGDEAVDAAISPAIGAGQEKEEPVRVPS